MHISVHRNDFILAIYAMVFCLKKHVKQKQRNIWKYVHVMRLSYENIDNLCIIVQDKQIIFLDEIVLDKNPSDGF